ncbi:MAG: endonuclease MutS2 [Bacteroidales bacterium]|nr:endonuclease MutS2 [Bacteroidales bacterium]
MIYPVNFEDKIGFSTIRTWIKKHCYSSLGEGFVDQMEFHHSFTTVEKFLEQTAEFKNILQFESGFPSSDYIDMIGELNRIGIPGTYMEETQVVDLKLSLFTILSVRTFLVTKKENYPVLSDLFFPEVPLKEIINEVDRIIDSKAQVRTNASDKLREIRRELASKESSVDRMLKRTLRHAISNNYIDKDTNLTIRNGRVVIPVNHSNKRMIKGFIHDQSATGQTVYIEPAEVFETNNEIRELQYAERREVVKILMAFADYIRIDIPELLEAYHFLGLIDFIRAKAALAIELGAVKPLLRNQTIINWQKAYHPILYISHKKQQREIVPLSIDLNQQQRILIISGPNAGGKSVCLKTVGLLQYMLQCGMLVPMSENSEAGIFSDIFIDIGDEQSLENDLSTYSSHLLNIKNFLDNTNETSLFMIDEFGTGTEPQIGGAIAETSLEELNNNKSFGVVTTHYANLKLMAEDTNGIINGAMLFDTEAMRPLYQLNIGKPGSSFAFEIARKIGLSESVLNRARLKTGKSQSDFDFQLQKLETEKVQIDEKKTQLKVADDFLSEVLMKYSKLHEDLESTKKEIINQAKHEAKQIIKDSNKLVEQTIREIKESQAEKETTKKARERLVVRKDELKQGSNQISVEMAEIVKSIPKPPKPKVKSKAKPKSIEIGVVVKISGQDTKGEVIEISGKQAVVAIGDIKMRMPIHKLEAVGFASDSKKKSNTRKHGSIVDDLNKKIAEFKSTLDIRGQRVEEALAQVQSYIDDAILLGVNEVEIIHGKGSGVLRTIIREWLDSVSEVKRFRDQHPDFGGSGVTVVKLN